MNSRFHIIYNKHKNSKKKGNLLTYESQLCSTLSSSIKHLVASSCILYHIININITCFDLRFPGYIKCNIYYIWLLYATWRQYTLYTEANFTYRCPVLNSWPWKMSSLYCLCQFSVSLMWIKTPSNTKS